jgi:hypothetical protein
MTHKPQCCVVCGSIDVTVAMQEEGALRFGIGRSSSRSPRIPHVLWDMPLRVIDYGGLVRLHSRVAFGPLSVLHETQASRAIAQCL